MTSRPRAGHNHTLQFALTARAYDGAVISQSNSSEPTQRARRGARTNSWREISPPRTPPLSPSFPPSLSLSLPIVHTQMHKANRDLSAVSSVGHLKRRSSELSTHARCLCTHARGSNDAQDYNRCMQSPPLPLPTSTRTPLSLSPSSVSPAVNHLHCLLSRRKARGGAPTVGVHGAYLAVRRRSPRCDSRPGRFDGRGRS